MFEDTSGNFPALKSYSDPNISFVNVNSTKFYRSLHETQSWEAKISTCTSRNTASSTKPLRFIAVFTAPATGQCHDPHESSPNPNILFGSSFIYILLYC